MSVRGTRARTVRGVAPYTYATPPRRSVRCATIISKVNYVPDHSFEPSKLTWSQGFARGFGASRLDRAHERARSSPHADAQVWRTDLKAVAAARLSHSLTWRHRVGARSKTPYIPSPTTLSTVRRSSLSHIIVWRCSILEPTLPLPHTPVLWCTLPCSVL